MDWSAPAHSKSGLSNCIGLAVADVIETVSSVCPIFRTRIHGMRFGHIGGNPQQIGLGMI
jgi:hypothetical protein